MRSRYVDAIWIELAAETFGKYHSTPSAEKYDRSNANPINTAKAVRPAPAVPILKSGSNVHPCAAEIAGAGAAAAAAAAAAAGAAVDASGSLMKLPE